MFLEVKKSAIHYFTLLEWLSYVQLGIRLLFIFPRNVMSIISICESKVFFKLETKALNIFSWKESSMQYYSKAVWLSMTHVKILVLIAFNISIK